MSGGEAIVDESRRSIQNAQLDWASFHAFMELMPDAIIAVDVNGLIRTLNMRAESDFGYPRGELISQPVEMLLPFAMAHQHRSQREHFLSRGYSNPLRVNRNLNVRRKDFSELPVDIYLSLAEVANEKIVVAVFRNVTERKRAEERLHKISDELEIRVKQRITELETANRHLEAYGYTVSHELRSPLRIILGFEQLLHAELNTGTDKQALVFLGRAMQETHRMMEIIDGLLALARVDHACLQVASIDMIALVNSVVDELRAAHTDCSFEVLVGSLPAARGDVLLIRQVFANLLANAIKYGRQHGKVRVTINGHCSGQSVVYQVQDDGPGFDSRHAEQIFQPFERAGNKDSGDGLGIGLTLVRRIVERHAGTIWAEGHANGGARFSFSLPA